MSKFLHREGLDWNKTTEEQVRFAYIRRLREQAAGRGASTATGAINIVEERARLAHHQANIAELEEATRRGALIQVERALAHWQDVQSSCRAKLLSVPTRLASLAAGRSEREVEASARKLISAALAELARGKHIKTSGVAEESAASDEEEVA